MKCVIDLPLDCGGWGRLKDVQAEIVDVAPHLASIATFAVHENPWEYLSCKWRVSNVETGFCVGQAYAGTREDAIRKARKFLAGVSKQKMVGVTKRAARMRPDTNE